MRVKYLIMAEGFPMVRYTCAFPVVLLLVTPSWMADGVHVSLLRMLGCRSVGLPGASAFAHLMKGDGLDVGVDGLFKERAVCPIEREGCIHTDGVLRIVRTRQRKARDAKRTIRNGPVSPQEPSRTATEGKKGIGAQDETRAVFVARDGALRKAAVSRINTFP